MKVTLKDLTAISPYEWELPQGFRHDMRVPVRFFAAKPLLEASLSDETFTQAINASTLPGMVDAMVVMPDMHQGYGFPIGGVGATLASDGVVSPGGIGYDINCGVRLLASSIPLDEAEPWLAELASDLNQRCPSGVGVKGAVQLSQRNMQAVCTDGANWARKNNLASETDLLRTEDHGCIDGADFSAVSERAIKRGLEQLGTLGAGNHFIEVDVVSEIFDSEAARVMGLSAGMLTVQIHTGSRGFGHQVCSDYVRSLQDAVRKYGISLPDRELVCAPIDSLEGQAYLGAMRCAANYAFVNRQLLANACRESFEAVFAGKVKGWHLHQVYDVAHNIGKMETHQVNGRQQVLCVHRKGATRAFPAGSAHLPEDYRKIGQPVLVPGSMGTGSWVLLGSEKSMQRAFGSACHGAGRTMSREKAKKEIHGQDLIKTLKRAGIEVRAGSMSGLAEEAPAAYKDVDMVVESITGAGICSKVARLLPLAVIKG